MDCRWGIITGRDASVASKVVAEEKPLVIRNVGGGTSFAADCVERGQWFSEFKAGEFCVARARKGQAFYSQLLGLYEKSLHEVHRTNGESKGRCQGRTLYSAAKLSGRVHASKKGARTPRAGLDPMPEASRKVADG